MTSRPSSDEQQHDNVVDSSKVRRNTETIQNEVGQRRRKHRQRLRTKQPLSASSSFSGSTTVLTIFVVMVFASIASNASFYLGHISSVTRLLNTSLNLTEELLFTLPTLSSIESSLLKRPIAAATAEDGSKESSPSTSSPSCAILLFGLPRAFEEYVLPSLIQNVIIPNVQYHCDYYMHYYHIDGETASRSGHGGKIDPDKVWLLQDAIEEVYRQYYNNNDQ